MIDIELRSEEEIRALLLRTKLDHEAALAEEVVPTLPIEGGLEIISDEDFYDFGVDRVIMDKELRSTIFTNEYIEAHKDSRDSIEAYVI